MSRNSRQAFTLIELLVVIAIIAILVGLMVPAVQKVRDAAARIQCANNLKQIALGMHNYEGVYKRLPPGVWQLPHGSPTPIGVQGVSWAIPVLPYIEQSNLYRLWRLDLNYYQQTDSARRTAVALYFCPAHRGPEVGSSVADDVNSQTPGGMHFPGALGDYAGNYGATGKLFVDHQLRGAFSVGGLGVRFNEITDGLSHTVLIGDKAVDRYKSAKHLDTSMYNGDNPSSFLRVAIIEPECEFGGPSFGSCHVGVIEVALCDGSVRSVPKAIDWKIFERLCQREDGLPSPDF